MQTIYLDADYRCYVSGGEGLTEAETSVFDGKCGAYIEGYRYVPEGQAWTREDGAVFQGETAAPWKDSTVLAAYQQQYETTMAELEEAYQEGVNSI